MTAYSTATDHPGAESQPGRAHRVIFLTEVGNAQSIRIEQNLRVLPAGDPFMQDLYAWRYARMEEYGWLPKDENGNMIVAQERSDHDDYDDLGPKHTTHVVLLDTNGEIAGYVRLLRLDPERFMMFNNQRFAAMLDESEWSSSQNRRAFIAMRKRRCMEVTRLFFSLRTSVSRKQEIVVHLVNAMLWECTQYRIQRAFALVSPSAIALLNSVGVIQDTGTFDINPDAVLVKFTPEKVEESMRRSQADPLRGAAVA
jgi:hypothetical protein